MATVVNNLTSDSEIDALSAKQGKELNNKIETLKTDVIKKVEVQDITVSNLDELKSYLKYNAPTRN